MRATAYMASKLGIVGLTRGMARELAPIASGSTRWRPGSRIPRCPGWATPRRGWPSWRGQNPTGRLAEPEDIADVIVFLATDDARHIVGQLIHVNGGDYLA